MPAGSRLAVYPGTFDPVHLGHLDVARRAAGIFDRVQVAVVRERPAKPLLFTIEERVALFRESLADLDNLDVRPYEGLTVRHAQGQGATFIIRGLRGAADFDFEYQLNTMNRHLAPDVDTVFLAASPEHLHLSSSLIKEVASQGGLLDGLVPERVASALRVKYALAGG